MRLDVSYAVDADSHKSRYFFSGRGRSLGKSFHRFMLVHAFHGDMATSGVALTLEPGAPSLSQLKIHCMVLIS